MFEYIGTRLDDEGIIKVADFGLARDLYEKLYFREDKREKVKFPFKWMAIESLHDGLFSEKTDVVSVVLAMYYKCLSVFRCVLL